jgi:lipid-binding SYLF domain-containing protein
MIFAAFAAKHTVADAPGAAPGRRIPGMMIPAHLGAAVTAVILLSTASPFARQASVESDEARRVRNSIIVFSEIEQAEDSAIPRSILSKAEGIAIFPDTLKAGFVVGGMRGRGILSARGADGWSAPAFLTLTGGSIGLQIGGQAADIILVINNRRGLENLLSNQFKIGADASVAAGPVGRDAQAATDLQLRAEILSYSRARGLFAGVTINGSTIRPDRDANQRFYGMRLDTKQIAFGMVANPPEQVAQWRAALDRYTR